MWSLWWFCLDSQTVGSNLSIFLRTLAFGKVEGVIFIVLCLYCCLTMSSSLHLRSSSRDILFSCFLKYFRLAAWRLNHVYAKDLTWGNRASMKGWNSSWNIKSFINQCYISKAYSSVHIVFVKKRLRQTYILGVCNTPHIWEKSMCPFECLLLLLRGCLFMLFLLQIWDACVLCTQMWN